MLPNKPPACSAPISERADSSRYAVTEALEQRDFQLLGDPQGALDTRHGVQLGDQLFAARVAAGFGSFGQQA
jgi:hypothetical protein